MLSRDVVEVIFRHSGDQFSELGLNEVRYKEFVELGRMSLSSREEGRACEVVVPTCRECIIPAIMT